MLAVCVTACLLACLPGPTAISLELPAPIFAPACPLCRPLLHR